MDRQLGSILDSCDFNFSAGDAYHFRKLKLSDVSMTFKVSRSIYHRRSGSHRCETMTNLSFQVRTFMRPFRGVFAGTQLKLKSFSVLVPQPHVPDDLSVCNVRRPGETGSQR